MEHPVMYVARVTHFLDRLIRDYGDYLYMGFVYFAVFLLAWMFSRRRQQPVHDIQVVILPLGPAPKRDPDPAPPPFPAPPLHPERHDLD